MKGNEAFSFQMLKMQDMYLHWCWHMKTTYWGKTLVFMLSEWAPFFILLSKPVFRKHLMWLVKQLSVISCNNKKKKTQKVWMNSSTFAAFLHLWHPKDLMLVSRVHLTGYVSTQAASIVCMCTYLRRCGSLYLVGVRPLALLLITLSCLLRPCNLPPLKCGFKKKRKKED